MMRQLNANKEKFIGQIDEEEAAYYYNAGACRNSALTPRFLSFSSPHTTMQAAFKQLSGGGTTSSQFGSQSLEDKFSAFKYFISGRGISLIALKATTSEILGPKKKHLTYLVAMTNEPNVSVPSLSKHLIRRARHPEWTVAFKSLITIHYLANYGNEKFIQNIASSTDNQLVIEKISNSFVDRTTSLGYDMSTFLRRYARYLALKIRNYRQLGLDFCKISQWLQIGSSPGQLPVINLPSFPNRVPAGSNSRSRGLPRRRSSGQSISSQAINQINSPAISFKTNLNFESDLSGNSGVQNSNSFNKSRMTPSDYQHYLAEQSEQVIETLSYLQGQFDLLLAFDASAKDLNNGIINLAFALLYKDFVKLYIAYQAVITRLLGFYFDVQQTDRVNNLLEAYKRFLVRMDKVSDLIRVIDQRHLSQLKCQSASHTRTHQLSMGCSGSLSTGLNLDAKIASSSSRSTTNVSTEQRTAVTGRKDEASLVDLTQLPPPLPSYEFMYSPHTKLNFVSPIHYHPRRRRNSRRNQMLNLSSGPTSSASGTPLHDYAESPSKLSLHAQSMCSPLRKRWIPYEDFDELSEIFEAARKQREQEEAESKRSFAPQADARGNEDIDEEEDPTISAAPMSNTLIEDPGGSRATKTAKPDAADGDADSLDEQPDLIQMEVDSVKEIPRDSSPKSAGVDWVCVEL